MSVDYLNPGMTENLTRVDIPVVDATEQTLDGYGVLVHARVSVDFAREFKCLLQIDLAASRLAVAAE